MRASLTTFVIAMTATAMACTRPVSPTSPTSLGSSAQAATDLGGGSVAGSVSEASRAAATDVLPFKGRLEGTYEGTGEPPLVSVHVEAGGNATHLGRFTLDSRHVVNFVDFTGAGTAELTAANGDQLTTTTTGVATPQATPGVFWIVETFTITGGTGRFAGATGQFVVERLSFPSGPANGTTSGSFEGSLSLKHGAH